MSTTDPQLQQKRREIVLAKLAEGSTVLEACQSAGIERSTEWRWQQDDPAYKEARVAALICGTSKVEDALLHTALGGYVEETTTTTNEDGDVEKVVITKKHVPANVRAQIFYLSNRKGTDWKLKQEIHNTGNVEITLPEGVIDETVGDGE